MSRRPFASGAAHVYHTRGSQPPDLADSRLKGRVHMRLGFPSTTTLGAGSVAARVRADGLQPERLVRHPASLRQHRSDDAVRSAAGNDPPNLRELSEKDVLNILAMARTEFRVDERRSYLMGHSMGGAGSLYLGSKYASNWAAIAPDGSGHAVRLIEDHDAGGRRSR